jgi:hypothetical protein
MQRSILTSSFPPAHFSSNTVISLCVQLLLPPIRAMGLFSLGATGYSAFAQTPASGPQAHPSEVAGKSQQYRPSRYATEYPGSDIGAQVTAAFLDCHNACQVLIPAGTYNNWTTPIVMRFPTQSLIGAGSALTVLNFTGSGDAILWQMNPYTVTQAGKISGISIHGTPQGTSGIHSGSIAGASFEDLHIDGFTASSASCLWLDNVNHGWMERTVMSRVELGFPGTGGCAKDMKMTRTGGTNSFGYNRWTDLKLNVNAGQIGISSESPLFFYHSQLSLTCNASAANGICISLTGKSNWDLNVYNLVGENSVGGGTGVFVDAGSSFRGYGFIDFPNMALTNENGATFGGTFRILGAPVNVTKDGGTISNFLGSGVSATVYPAAVAGMDTPAGYGILSGANIQSPYVSMYNWGGRNAFVVGTLNFNAPLSTMTQVARIDTSGNVHAAGAFFASGSDYAESIPVEGPRSAYIPGDVLAIDPQHNGTFERVAVPYSTRVAGVFATKSGVVGSSHGLGAEEFRSEVPLAITGIAPCKVTIENGPVQRGDLLVSSSEAGYAMKATDRARMPGAIIGKALEPLVAGKGVINILVTLE